MSISGQGSQEEFEEVDYFDLDYYQYISQLVKTEDEFHQELEFINSLQLKLQLIVSFLVEQLNKEQIRKCIQNLSKVNNHKQLNDKLIKIVSNLKTQYNKLNQKQGRQELSQILLWMLFDIDNS